MSDSGFQNRTAGEMALVGWESATGALVCVECGADGDLLKSHKVGALERRVVRPSVGGHYIRTKEADGYDKPCALCGWPLC